MIDARQWDIGKYNPVDFETITVSTSAIGLTPTKVDPGTSQKRKRAFISVENNRIRFTFDGTTPTSTVGHILVPTQTFLFEGFYQLNQLQFIRVDSADAIIQVSYLI